MRDLPGWIWILSVFVVGAIGVFIYGKMAPEELPTPTSPWSFVEESRDGIERRGINLAENEAREEQRGIYHLKIERLENIENPSVFGRYVIRIRPTGFIPRYLLWNEMGLDVAFMDRQPSDAFGDLELMSVRKVKKPVSE